ERVAPGADRAGGVGPVAVELGIHLAQDPEGGVVVAEEHVQAVLLDAAMVSPAARTLATQPPPPLVDGDGVQTIPPGTRAELPRRREPRHASAEDHYPVAAHTQPASNWSAARVSVELYAGGTAARASVSTSRQSGGRCSA